MPEDLFDEPSILASFDAVAACLEEVDAPAGVLIVVGGSFMALHRLRESTHDVDTVNLISDAIRAAATSRISKPAEAPAPSTGLSRSPSSSASSVAFLRGDDLRWLRPSLTSA